MPLDLDEDEKTKLNAFLTPQDIQRTNNMGNLTSPQLPFKPTVSTPDISEFKSSDEDQTPVEKVEDKVKDSHPGHTPDDLANYVKGQESQIDKYGPEQEKAVMDSIIKSRGSLGRNFARGAGTFADAIMQGVAGAGNPGFLKSIDENEGRAEDMSLKAPQIEQEMNAKNMGAKQALEGMTSSTPLGASEVAPLQAFFERVGIPKDKIPALLKNPAAARSVIEPFATIMTSEDKIKMETLLKQLELSQRSGQIAQETANQKEERKQEALKSAASLGITDRLFHPDIVNAINKSAGIGESAETPAITSQKELDQLPVGAKYTFNGQPHTKRK